MSSGATSAGSHGCEFWLSRSIALGGDKFLNVGLDACQVLHSDPRRLIVSVSTPLIQFVAVVAHAPCVCSTDGVSNLPEVIVMKMSFNLVYKLSFQPSYAQSA